LNLGVALEIEKKKRKEKKKQGMKRRGSTFTGGVK